MVNGSGFGPYAAIGIEQCSPLLVGSPNPTSECDTSKVVLAATDASGAFTTVVRILQTGALAPDDFSPADVDAVCPPPTDSAQCVIVARNTTDQNQQALAPIAFKTGPVQATVMAASVSATGGGPLPATGAGPRTLVLAGSGLLLIDVGYLLVSATRPPAPHGLSSRKRRG